MSSIKFIDNNGSFTLEEPENTSGLYFPLASETGLKSSITPNLGGDAKLDQESFILEPVSIEDLHDNRSTRNFWCVADGAEPYSVSGASAAQEAARFTGTQDGSSVSAGLMWHVLRRSSASAGISSCVTSFIPRDANVEIMHVEIENTEDHAREITAFAAIPIYGRSADNLRDHRHVTSLLHRIRVTGHGVEVRPTMSFDERGHRRNERIYYVRGCTGDGRAPECFYPTAERFLGEGGTYIRPRAVYEHRDGCHAGHEEGGREAAGAMRFPPVTLSPGGKADYIVMLGTEMGEEAIDAVFERFNSTEKVMAELEDTRKYWLREVNVDMHTASADFDCLMKWVGFQPFLRRLFGCSFLPHHDYGRGGRGWRDLWQDCLSLLLMKPGNVGKMIEANFGGVRIDGTNATIIGSGDGNFIADRNGIARVWMDHALWPFITTRLYIDQTGDIDILMKKAPYFKDAQSMRGTAADESWDDGYGGWQRDSSGEVYEGSVIEHLLIQNLTEFYEVGEHNIFRLRGADWNDALDMASERGESVAFTCAYAGNLRDLAGLLRSFAIAHPGEPVELLEEIGILLGGDEAVFCDVGRKNAILAEYCKAVSHCVGGACARYSPEELADDLQRKADWLAGYLRRNEWLEVGEEGWFNSYYDNNGNPVDGMHGGQVRMMLTGQVFSIMGGVADDWQIEKIVRAADRHLYSGPIGGYRLNTDFKELKFDMGRMFGFAYGEKENGAVFSHMCVMYANALYRRGYAREGWKSLRSLADAALDFGVGRIYPGIPEYFRADGRGMYHYLTGAASWYLLTMITEVFGVRGSGGDLLIAPKLLAEQFDGTGTASIRLMFAGRYLNVVFKNDSGRDYGDYSIRSASLDGEELEVGEGVLLIGRGRISGLSDGEHEIAVTLA